VAFVAAADGIPLAYSTAGRGPHVLTCLHSLSLDGSWFEPFADALAEATAGAYRCLLPDLRGHGQSGYGDQPATLALLADDIRAVWDDAGVQAGAVFGVSLGGMVAQALAATAPEQVSAAILAATAGSFDDAARDATRQRAETARAPGGIGQLLAPTLERWFVGDELPDDPLVERARAQLGETRGGVHADFLTAMTEVGSFRVQGPMPVLVLGGLGDRSIPRPVLEALAAGLPGAELDFLPGGHLFPFTNPNEAASRVAKFLEQHVPEVLA
jgi:3-oxoadipate enol-lactonase